MNSEIRKQRLKDDVRLARLKIKKESTFNYDLTKQDIVDSTGKVQSVTSWLTTTLGTKLPMKKKKPARRSKKYMQSVPWKHDFKNNCVKCNRAYHLQKHHIVYNPSVEVFLCENCHSKITGMNSRAVKIAGTSLTYRRDYTNRVRIILWRWFKDNPWPTQDGKPVRRLSKTKIKEILHKFNTDIKSPIPQVDSPTPTGHKLPIDIGLPATCAGTICR